MTGKAELKWTRVGGEQAAMAREFVISWVGDGGWREKDNGGQGEVDAWLI